MQKFFFMYSCVKRMMDIVLSLFFLIVSFPLWIIIACAVKFDSPGPIFFSQIRLGKDKKPFLFYKFRSMYTECDQEIHKNHVEKLLTSQTGERNEVQRYHIPHDSRVTRVGTWIRKTSLDELPQLWNVLKGQMSLVGPRPAIPYELEYYKDYMMKRFSVKPGITGYWQVNARHAVGHTQMIDMDIFYIDHWSIWMDICIIIKTPWKMINR